MAMTQAQVDEAFNQTKAEWDRMCKESNKSRLVFFMSKEATNFLYHFSKIREQVIEMGFSIPELEPAITITEHN